MFGSRLFRRHRKATALLVIAFVALVVGIAVGSSGGSTPTPRPAFTGQVTTGAPAGPDPQATASPSVQAAAMTSGQQQVVESARNYLSTGLGFSLAGLTKQLTSSAGGFSPADAQFAIGYLRPDWDAQAVIAAKGYLASGMGLSRSALRQQLTSAYGGGFTDAQADYALGKVGM